MAPTPVLNEPAGQSVHVCWPELAANEPGKQVVGSADPTEHEAPAGHGAQAVWPASGWYVPAEQLLQVGWNPVSCWTVPGGHAVQLPPSGMKEPAAQGAAANT